MDLVNKFLALQGSLVHSGFQDGNFDQEVDSKIKQIIKSCCQLLNVSRVSVWFFSDDQKSIICSHLYIQDEQQFEQGIELKEAVYPNYFKALKQNRVINADDARVDERTNEFLDDYLKPLGILSMLDVPIFSEGQLSGLICIESNHQRCWDMAEISYSVSVADTISLIYAQARWFSEKQKLTYLERIDPLTNLENRLFFQKRIHQVVNSTIKNSHCAVILVGMDGFTTINDRFGYHFANKVLCETAHRLEHINIGQKFTLSRIGGDVFAFWLPQIDSVKIVDELILAIKQLFENEIKTPSGEMIIVSSSIGIFYSQISELVDTDPLRKAELAMKKAKAELPGSTCYYQPEWLKEHQEAISLEKEFIAALNNAQIVAFYQPIVKPDYPASGISLEALVRWNHPTKGILTPYVILPIAKRLGLMQELGEAVLAQTCHDIRDFIDRGIQINKVSVNLSSEQLFAPNLINQVQKYINAAQIPCSLLEFEIVEELIAGDSGLLSKQLAQLMNLGIDLSIDDFGTGYSSLSRLKHLHVSKLKIDKSFVDGLPNNENDICIAQAIIGLAKGMNLQIVAEGVETKLQADWLLANGCDYLQGYLISKPVSARDILTFTKQDNVLLKLS